MLDNEMHVSFLGVSQNESFARMVAAAFASQLNPHHRRIDGHPHGCQRGCYKCDHPWLPRHARHGWHGLHHIWAYFYRYSAG